MSAVKSGKAIKEALLRIITESIGSKTADMYRDFYDAQSTEVAIASAEELLVEFVGRQRATEQIRNLRQTFKLVKAKAV